MYQPQHFVETRPEVLAALMRDHPLASVVVADAGGLSADPVPLLWVPGPDGATGRLQGHVARANPLWRKAGADGIDCLAIFSGPSAYVSPSWYPGKAEHHKVVPTWNYATVQARGRLVAHDDAGWLEGFLSRLTGRFESGRTMPWAVGDAPADYVASMMKAIVGIELQVAELAGKFKLSQNRPAADRAGVLAAMGGETQPDAAAMHALMSRPG